MDLLQIEIEIDGCGHDVFMVDDNPMTDPWCCYINGVPWIPSIYPQIMLALIYDPSYG